MGLEQRTQAEIRKECNPNNLKYDLMNGQHTYGQHLAIMQAFERYDKIGDSSERKRADLMVEVFDILNYEVKDVTEAFIYFNDVVKAMHVWAEKSQKMLKSSVTSIEAKSAGAEKVSEIMGSFGVVKHLAKEYHYKLDEILQVEWVTIFTLLYTDRLENELEHRMHKQIMEKYKHRGVRR